MNAPLPLNPDLTGDGALIDGAHLFQARVYYADTDFSGFVYHARYLEWLERGRSDFLRLLNIHHTELAALGEPLVWVVRHMDIRFEMPARIDDVIRVQTRCTAAKGARIVLHQSIMLEDKASIRAQVEAALVTKEGKPRRLPKEWLNIIPIA